MAEIKDKQEFEAWLEGKPREVAQVLAFRSAMRVLPLVGDVLREGGWKGEGDPHLSFIRPVFCAASVGWLTPLVLSQAAAVSALAAALSATHSANSTDFAADSATYSAALAAYSAVDSALSARSASSAADSADSAADSADSAADSVDDPIALWHELSQDVSALEAGTAPEELKTAPLWQEVGDLSHRIDQEWVEMKQNLPATAPEWRFWCEWYERVRDGQPFPDLKKRFAPILAKPEPEKDDRAGHLTRIAALIEAAVAEQEQEAPPPLPVEEEGVRFILETDSGKNQLMIAPPAAPLADDATQKALHQVLQEEIAEFRTKVAQLGNAHPQLATSLLGYAREIEKPYEALNIAILWAKGSILQGMAEEFQSQNSTLEAPLDTDTLALLTSLSGIHGAFILGFELGKTLSQRRNEQALSEQERIAKLEVTREILRKLSQEKGVSQPARDLFTVMAIAPQDNTTFAEKSQEAARSVTHNAIVRMLSWAMMCIKQGGQALVQKIAEQVVEVWIWPFVVGNVPSLLLFAEPTLRPVLEYVLRYLELF